MKTKTAKTKKVTDGIENYVIKPVFSDARGDINDVLEEKVGHVGLITFTKGAVRANHYHKKSVQYSYILKGKIKITLHDLKGTFKKEFIAEEGTFTRIPPKIVHIYTALTNATILDMTTLNRKNKGYEQDTVRMPK